jgi:hypothetical protein
MLPENSLENLTLFLQNPYHSKDHSGHIQPFLQRFYCHSRHYTVPYLLLYWPFSSALSIFITLWQLTRWSRGVTIEYRTGSGFHTVNYADIVAPPVAQLEAFTINFTGILLKKGGQKILWA